MHETRTRQRPQRVKKWLRSPHNKFKRQTQDAGRRSCEKSQGSQNGATKVCRPSSSSASETRLALVGIIFICCLFPSPCFMDAQASQTKATTSASHTSKPLEFGTDQAAIGRGIATTSTSAALVTATKSLPTNSSGARRRPRVFRIRAAPTNGRFSLVRLELGDAKERQPKLVGGDEPAVEQFGQRTATGVKTAQRPVQVSREPKLMRPINQEPINQVNVSEPCPPGKHTDKTSVAASSPMLRLTTSPTQAPSALAASSSPNQQISADEAAARSDGESIFSLIDEYDSKIITNRTRAQLSCDSGEMVLRLNFSDPFKGIVYPERNRLSPCRFFGDEHKNYELRLPLRGCGTRQAAPRVFVNDVIVRFHKSLELEEDEVKTLICRYPPPLAPSPQLADGSYLAQGDQRSTTAATIITTTTMDGGSVEQEGGAQFEFVDPTDARPQPDSAGGSSGNIETLSENLVIAPNGQQHLSDSSYTNRLGPTRQQADPFNQRNSALLDPSIAGNQQDPGRSGFPFISGLSSIELLFLISTLMFLVLLALGLTASYYCFRRHANRRSTERASAILKRKRRYVSPSNLLSAHQAAAAAAAAANAPSSMQQQHHYYPGGQQPSSPDSDLSARSLLAAGHYAPTPARYALNRSFVPDQPKPKQYAAISSHPTYKQQVIGRRGETARAQPGYPQPHYLATHRRSSQFSPMVSGYATGRAGKERWPLYLINNAEESNNASQSLSLSRAKSLSSVNHPALQRQWAAATGGRRGGQPATVSRACGPVRWSSEADDRASTIRVSNSQRRHRKQSPATDALGKSDKLDLEMNNNNNNNDTDHVEYLAIKHHKPKLVLKSIEDSFITNVTEIHEQEYTKRDSLRPLDLAEWRSMQPQVMKKRHRKRSSSTSDNSGVDDLLPSPPLLSGEQGRKVASGEDEDFYLSEANANLRSLTELDVNFARSLLAGPSLAPLPQQTTDFLRPAVSADQLAQSDYATPNSLAASRQGERRASSVPEVAVERDSSRPLSESPDLILSPEYDCSRLELARPKSSLSQNSVSYV